MLWLLVVLLQIAFVQSASIGALCDEFATACHEETCTPNAFVGSVVDSSQCPFVRVADGTVMRECTACRSGYTCTQAGECVLATSLLGSSCSSDLECKPWIPDISEAPYRCAAGTCVEDRTGLMLPGDTGCSSNSDCFGASTCSAGLCVGSNACSDSRECEPEKSCQSNVCVDRFVAGSECDDSTDCPNTQMCFENICENRFKFVQNNVCGFDDPISQNFGCAANLQCVQVGNTNEYRCEPTPISGTACNPLVTGQCGASQICECDRDSSRGTCKPVTEDGRCATFWRQYFQCADLNGCRTENYDRIFEGSCVRDNCFSEWSSVQKCRSATQLDTFSQESCEIARRTEIKAGNIIAPLDENDAAGCLFNIFE